MMYICSSSLVSSFTAPELQLSGCVSKGEETNGSDRWLSRRHGKRFLHLQRERFVLNDVIFQVVAAFVFPRLRSVPPAVGGYLR